MEIFMKLQIKIERSLIPGIPFIALAGIFFIIFFFGEMFLFSILPCTSSLPDDSLSIFALLSSAAVLLFLSLLDEKRHGNTQTLEAEIHKEYIQLTCGNKNWNIPYSDIKEVVKIMRYDRTYTEKGKYKIVIKRRKHRSLAFMTTEKEYQEHCDFQHTDLARLYYALRDRGIKCC